MFILHDEQRTHMVQHCLNSCKGAYSALHKKASFAYWIAG